MKVSSLVCALGSRAVPAEEDVHEEQEEVEAAADDEHVQEGDLPHHEVAVASEARCG